MAKHIHIHLPARQSGKTAVRDAGEFEESKHPRAQNGQFGSGGGGSGGAKSAAKKAGSSSGGWSHTKNEAAAQAAEKAMEDAWDDESGKGHQKAIVAIKEAIKVTELGIREGSPKYAPDRKQEVERLKKRLADHEKHAKS